MEIYLQNTLSGKKEVFTPLESHKVTMYNCGPTVYDYAHIGNLRSYVFADVLRRMFEYNGYTVDQVMNITDIGHLSGDGDDGEDKMTKALKREGKPLSLEAMREIADFYFAKFKDDLVALNIELPTHFPFASDNIAEDIALISTLTEKGFTYSTSDGIYFNTSKFGDYGALGQVGSNKEDHSRIGLNPEKKNSRDFALWKFSSDLGYDASFGKGFPGWHIECSAMSVKYLGPQFDIHTGGIDHIPVHHNNEIAQSVCAGYPYARYWMHNAFLNVANPNPSDGQVKMAKSEGNFITLQTVKEKNVNPLALRYFFLTARYSSPLDYSLEALQGSETAWKRLKKIIQTQDESPSASQEASRDEYYKNTFTQYINDDLDTPKALALVWDMIKDGKVSDTDKRKMILDFDRVLGLELDKPEEKVEIPEDVQKLIDERNTARANKDFALSDSLRTHIESLGFKILDTDSGTEVERV